MFCWKKSGIRGLYSPSPALDREIKVCDGVYSAFSFLASENEKFYSPYTLESTVSPEQSVSVTENGMGIYTAFSGKIDAASNIKHPLLGNVPAFKIANPEFNFELPKVKYDIDAYSPDEIIEWAKRFGIIDKDGEPLYKKMLRIRAMRPSILICDAVCDTPFESASVSLLKEFGEQVAKATVVASYAVGADRSCIAVYDGKGAPVFPSSIDSVPIMKINFRYPSSPLLDMQIRGWGGGEKIGAFALFALYNVLVSHSPFPYALLTIDGTGVDEPVNVFAPVGAPVEDVVRIASPSAMPHIFIIGGIMKGKSCLSATPISQNMTSVTVNDVEKYPKTRNCVNCGECVTVCPKKLLPVHIMNAYKKGNSSTLEKLNPELCMECGCCSFVCPSRINIMQNVIDAKAFVMKGEDR